MKAAHDDKIRLLNLHSTYDTHNQVVEESAWKAKFDALKNNNAVIRK